MCVIELLEVNRLMHIKEVNLVLEKINHKSECSRIKFQPMQRRYRERHCHCQHQAWFLACVIIH
ncbi:MAG: hypothetical protein ACW990_04260 [Promethearchaeota archaeon]